jgi:hypothetical protein
MIHSLGRLLLAPVVMGLLSCAATPTADSTPSRPNIIFILLDDQGWADAGAFGHPYMKTPHIDRLVGQSIRFEQFYVSNPVCSPSRAAFIDGALPGSARGSRALRQARGECGPRHARLARSGADDGVRSGPASGLRHGAFRQVAFGPRQGGADPECVRRRRLSRRRSSGRGMEGEGEDRDKRLILGLTHTVAPTSDRSVRVGVDGREKSRAAVRPEIVITVSDTGPGVPNELREKIFYPFFTTKQKGSGVGLATAQKIVAGHGGVIEVDSEAGGGCVFRVRVPIEDEKL